jgi:hypothetical protein
MGFGRLSQSGVASEKTISGIVMIGVLGGTGGRHDSFPQGLNLASSLR